MLRINIFLSFSLLSFLLFVGCKNSNVDISGESVSLKSILNEEISTLAFGSCNHQDAEQVLWEFINEINPQIWLWLGDNIYADTEDMGLMKQMYQKQKTNPAYSNFIANKFVLGIWDDHDYGLNDGGKEYLKKDESKKLMFDFLEIDKDDSAWNRKGAYQSYLLGSKGKEIKIILLDSRYFRDKQLRSGDKYIENPKGDILGEAQWSWLENELKTSTAKINIIATGIQMIPAEHRFEKWANFPTARKRLFDLFDTHQPKNLILLSGDRHIAEFSKIQLENYPQDIFEVTSSGLTHAYTSFTGEANSHRVGNVVHTLNYGLMRINWEEDSIELRLEIRGINNDILQYQTLSFGY